MKLKCSTSSRPIFQLSVVVLVIYGVSAASQSREDGEQATPGLLRPSHLPEPEMFEDFHTNTTVRLPGKENQPVKVGSVSQINRVHSAAPSSISVLSSIVDKESVETVLKLLRAHGKYDEDPDTVDGMPTYEIFLDSPELGGEESMKVFDSDPQTLPERTRLRKKIRNILDPILDEKITPFVRQQYPHLCNNTAERLCTPCYSLIRRYRHGERQSHATHHDGHAIVTVVTSFSTYDTDYRGGLYVSTGYGQRKFINLSAGDAVSHQSTLLHGVQVLDLVDKPAQTERWSWILWYRDSTTTCRDYSHEWFQACSDDGDAVCQELHATKVGNIPGISNLEQETLVLQLNRASAEQGSGNAAVKMARAHLKLLPSILTYNATEAARFYNIAIESHHPDGHYGMAGLLLSSIAQAQDSEEFKSKKGQTWKDLILAQVVTHLEQGAMLGHAFSMFNLGIAHVYGYGMNNHKIDGATAASWMVQSGLPEGYFVASHQAASVGDSVGHLKYDRMARVLGYYHPWRKEARHRTGSGGAGGVDINLPWPLAHDGRRPPVF